MKRPEKKKGVRYQTSLEIILDFNSSVFVQLTNPEIKPNGFYRRCVGDGVHHNRPSRLITPIKGKQTLGGAVLLEVARKLLSGNEISGFHHRFKKLSSRLDRHNLPPFLFFKVTSNLLPELSDFYNKTSRTGVFRQRRILRGEMLGQPGRLSYRGLGILGSKNRSV